MRLLLDTHLLIWASENMLLVPKRARALMAEPANELYFSACSIWEIAIKHRMERNFKVDVPLFRRRLLNNGYREAAISGEHAAATALLPAIHTDPFDRLLVAQATLEGITLLTADSVLAGYPGPIELV